MHTGTRNDIGSIRETQEILDFCAEHSIKPDIKVILIRQVNDAYPKVEDGEVGSTTSSK